jgi:hypothetical protein
VPRWLQWVLAAACFALLGRILLANPLELQAGLAQVRSWPLIAGGLLFCLGHYALHALVWHLLARRSGLVVPPKTAVRLWSDSLLGRYLPGGVWGLAARIEGYRQAGVPVGRTTVAMFFEQVITVGSAGSVSLFVLLRLDPGPWSVAAIIGAIVAGGAVMSRPRFVARLAGALARRLGRSAPRIDTEGPARVWDLWVLSVIAYSVSGLGFFAFLQGFVSLSWTDFPYTLGSLFFAGLAGFVAFMVPTGLGIREGALAWLLVPLMPSPLAALVAILSRPWMLAAELLWLAGVRAFVRPPGPGEAPTP